MIINTIIYMYQFIINNYYLLYKGRIHKYRWNVWSGSLIAMTTNLLPILYSGTYLIDNFVSFQMI